MKIQILGFLVAVLVAVLVVLFSGYGTEKNDPEPAVKTETELSEPDVLSSRFVIGDSEFVLNRGVAEREIAPGAASREQVRVFGEPVYGDLDADGDLDAAVLLEHTAGGSGVFYYAVLALRDDTAYRTTNTLLLGDRIAPQTMSIEEGRAVYNFAKRNFDESFATPPSVGVSLYVHYDAASGTIGEWVKDFEGESNFTERYRAQVDRVAVVFEHMNFTSYRLVTNGRVREGALNTERGFGEDVDATVFVLDWQKPEGEQLRYVRLTDEPGRLYLLDSEGKQVVGNPLVLEE